jgi:outer membrane protein
MKKILFISILLSAFLTTNAQDIATNEGEEEVAAVSDSLTEALNQPVVVVEKTVKFGYLSYNYVIKNMDEYSETMKTIEGLRATYENEVNRNEENFSKLFAEYVEGQQSFSEIILIKSQKELQQAMEQSLEFRDEARALLEKREKEVMDKLHKRLVEVIVQLGKERHYAFILNTDGDTYPFVNPEMGDDVTQEVMFRLRGGME